MRARRSDRGSGICVAVAPRARLVRLCARAGFAQARMGKSGRGLSSDSGSDSQKSGSVAADWAAETEAEQDAARDGVCDRDDVRRWP